MKTSSLLLISLLVMGLTSCKSQNKSEYSYEDFPLEVTDEYKKVWSKVYSGNIGLRYSYELEEPKVFRSIPIEGKFSINPEGKLCGFTLSKTYNYNGTLIPKGSRYNGNEEDFYFFSLSKDTIIKGFPVFHKEDGFIFWTENNVNFYNDGTIKGFGLSKDMIINGIPCNAAKDSRTVDFYHNGEIRHCYLSENTEINGYPCRGGDENSELWLRSDGKPLSFFLSKDYTIDGNLYPEETQVIFDRKNKVHYLSGHLKYLHFDDNDNVHNVVLKDDLELEGISFSKES